MCSVLETQVNKEKVNIVAEKVFAGWDWYSNASMCKIGCMITIGWNKNLLNLMVICSSGQSILYKVVTTNGDLEFYV